MLKRLLREKMTWLALSVLVFGACLNISVSLMLFTKYGESLPVLHDLLLDNLPYLEIQWLYDLFVIISVEVIILYAYKHSPEKIPYYLVVFGIMQILRGFFIALTPVGSPNHGALGLFKGSAFRSGVYPSGHTASAVLALIFTSGWYRSAAWVCLIGLVSTLLLGRGHYSIDIFSAMIFAYAVYMFSEKYLKKHFVLRWDE